MLNASNSSCLSVNCDRRKQFCYNYNFVLYNNCKPIMYVNQYSHLSRSTSVFSLVNGETDILHRRSAWVNRISNGLCYFSQLDNFVKLKRLTACCPSPYGCVLFDLMY